MTSLTFENIDRTRAREPDGLGYHDVQTPLSNKFCAVPGVYRLAAAMLIPAASAAVTVVVYFADVYVCVLVFVRVFVRWSASVFSV